MTIKVIKQNTTPEMIVKLNSLIFNDIPTPFRLVTETIIINKKQMAEERHGDTNQLNTILIS
jgi:hypothetical protein